MTWVMHRAYVHESGEFRNTFGAVISSEGASLITTPLNGHGNYAAQLDFTITADSTGSTGTSIDFISDVPVGYCGVAQAWFNPDALPSGEIPLCSKLGSALGTWKAGWVLQTDGSFKLYDSDGTTVLGQTSGATLGTGAYTCVTFIFDRLTLSGSVWCAVKIGDTEVFARNIAFTTVDFTSWVIGMFRAAADASRGTKLRVDDWSFRRTATAADCPHLAAYPRLKTARAAPIANGTYTAWANDFNAVDEVGTADGSQISNNTTVATETYTFEGQAATEIAASGDTIRHLGNGFMHLVSALPVDGKWSANNKQIWILSGNTETGSAVGDVGGTLISGYESDMARPGGGSWAVADMAAIEAGFAYGSGSTKTWAVDQFALMWHYSTDSENLAVTTTPTRGFVPQKRRSMKAQLIR